MINLSKGQKINLSKDIKCALVGLGWDTNKYDGSADFDLDASVFLLGAGDQLVNEKDLIFYNNLKGRNNCIVHAGDNRTGSGDGDDEQIRIDFSKIPAEIQKIAVVVTIHEAEARRQNFGLVSNAYIHIDSISSMQDVSGTPEVRYDLGEDFSIETSVLVAEIYKNNGSWKVAAKGVGYARKGLEGFLKDYGYM